MAVTIIFRMGFPYDARAFKKRNGDTHKIFRVESDEVFRADAEWLNLNDQNAIASFSAHRYWSGASTPIPNGNLF